MKSIAYLGILTALMTAQLWAQPEVFDGGKGNIRINCTLDDTREFFLRYSPRGNCDHVAGHGLRGRLGLFWDRGTTPSRCTPFYDLQNFGLRPFDDTPFRLGGCGRRVIFLDACHGGSLVIGPEGPTSNGIRLANMYQRPVICAAGTINASDYRVTLSGGGCGTGHYYLVFPDGRMNLLSERQIQRLMQCNPSLASGGTQPIRGGLCVASGGGSTPIKPSSGVSFVAEIGGNMMGNWAGREITRNFTEDETAIDWGGEIGGTGLGSFAAIAACPPSWPVVGAGAVVRLGTKPACDELHAQPNYWYAPGRFNVVGQPPLPGAVWSAISCHHAGQYYPLNSRQSDFYRSVAERAYGSTFEERIIAQRGERFYRDHAARPGSCGSCHTE